MPSIYEGLKPGMDDEVDSVLGDTISYRIRGAAPVDVMGFVKLDSDDIAPIQPHAVRWTCKLRMPLLPAGGPHPLDRIANPKLPAVMRPAADTIDDDGTYYFFDLQRA